MGEALVKHAKNYVDADDSGEKQCRQRIGRLVRQSRLAAESRLDIIRQVGGGLRLADRVDRLAYRYAQRRVERNRVRRNSILIRNPHRRMARRRLLRISVGMPDVTMT